MTLPIFLSLLPIVAGVAVSSMSDASFQLLGLAMAMGTAACSQAAAPCHRATVPAWPLCSDGPAMISQP